MSKSLNKYDLIKALDSPDQVILDARSPGEYKHAHIPGAMNVPLLNDLHREAVGIAYKKEGRDAAVIKGFELVGPLFADLILQVKALAFGKEILIYCWRGGMRSGILSWLLETAGFRVQLLEGGYKAYRSVVLESIALPRNFIILGGKTGSGKTEILEHLKNSGESIVDLEKLAAHKGSSFGALGQSPQPSNEQFENYLFNELRLTGNDEIVWLENESRSIGRVKIPDSIFDQMRKAPIVEIDVPLEVRKERILNEYGSFPLIQLTECTARLEKRLGGLRLKQCLTALEEDRKSEWLDYLLEYYDETYSYGMTQRESSKCLKIGWEIDEAYVHFASRIKKLKAELFNTAIV